MFVIYLIILDTVQEIHTVLKKRQYLSASKQDLFLQIMVKSKIVKYSYVSFSSLIKTHIRNN